VMVVSELVTSFKTQPWVHMEDSFACASLPALDMAL